MYVYVYVYECPARICAPARNLCHHGSSVGGGNWNMMFGFGWMIYLSTSSLMGEKLFFLLFFQGKWRKAKKNEWGGLDVPISWSCFFKNLGKGSGLDVLGVNGRKCETRKKRKNEFLKRNFHFLIKKQSRRLRGRSCPGKPWHSKKALLSSVAFLKRKWTFCQG